jgi:hypothetical protein
MKTHLQEFNWPKSKLSKSFQVTLNNALREKFKGVFYVIGYDLYHNDKKLLKIDPERDSVSTIIRTLSKKIKENTTSAGGEYATPYAFSKNKSEKKKGAPKKWSYVEPSLMSDTSLKLNEIKKMQTKQKLKTLIERLVRENLQESSKRYMRIPPDVVGNELYKARQDLNYIYSSLEHGNDYDEKSIPELIKLLEKIHRSATKHTEW